MKQGKDKHNTSMVFDYKVVICAGEIEHTGKERTDSQYHVVLKQPEDGRARIGTGDPIFLLLSEDAAKDFTPGATFSVTFNRTDVWK